MNRAYGFEGEVKAKYTETVFKCFSEIFNAIPVGNLVENKILVIHGGAVIIHLRVILQG